MVQVSGLRSGSAGEEEEEEEAGGGVNLGWLRRLWDGSHRAPRATGHWGDGT